ncbi:MAG: exodeoxyribonuclease beta subunit, partial [Pseudonocardiales bacterium]|nr:exodeoxyribonuclease beta subunit [Pseudonocardiales bacterium]
MSVTVPATPAPFDPTAALGEGITVLEASAGTGKTHAVASLVVAEVAAGRPLEDLLIVTFTRKATGTLRHRVWQRLADASRSLNAALHGDTDSPTDPLVAQLAVGPSDEVARRHMRLTRALSDFDAATIATTHGFCQQVLASLGV